MTGNPISLKAVLAETGLLPALAPGAADLGRPVLGLIFLETAADAGNVAHGELVLATGHAVQELTPAGLVAQLALCGVAGLVARYGAEAGVGEALAEAAARRQLPLVLLPLGTPWTGVLEALQHSLDRARISQRTAATPRDGLLDLAESLSRATANPVTVEDPQFAVKAYSSQSGELDPVRVQTILSKRAPEAVHKGFEKYGVTRVLHEARGPVRIEAIPAMGLNGTRVVVPIRSGQTLLGYIWVIESARRLDAAEMALLTGAARSAAALLLEQQAERDMQFRLQEEFLLELLQGQVASEEEATVRLRALGLQLGPVRLMLMLDRLASGGERGEKDLVAVCRDVSERMQVSGLAGAHPDGAVVLLGLPSGQASAATHRAAALAEAIRTAAGEEAVPLWVGVGEPFKPLPAAKQSLEQARGAVLLGQSLWRAPRVIAAADLGVYRLLAPLADPIALAARTHPILRTLHQYDEENGTDLLASLGVYLEHAGNVRQAARGLTIHPNTMLYRLQRMAEVAGFNPDDAGQRFLLDLEYRLRRVRSGGAS